MFEKTENYPQEIEENGRQFGFKAANLLYLEKKLKSIQDDSELVKAEIQVTVPIFVPLSKLMIEQHLDAHASDWRQHFAAFQKAYDQQNDKTTLDTATIATLEQLQNDIRQCFSKHPFSDTSLNKILDTADSTRLFMARSTGIHEDKVDMANPGGNESVITSVAGISQALGTVVASYVGEKSLLQRLKAKDQDITAFPVMPVLIQVLVGEGLDSTTRTENKVTSGVMYTNSGSIRMQSAWGHGEYVVNSKGATDNYYCSAQGITYSEIQPKTNRLVAQRKGAKMALAWQENNSQDQYSPSLPADALAALSKIANQIEASYQMRMDIEFVYDHAHKTIHIVQARPIPVGDRKNLEPSSLSPRYLARPTETTDFVEGLQVLTPEVNKAAVITNASQVLVYKDIKDALIAYLKPSTVGQNIRAVIIENDAADTSHEAGQFNLNAIPVMRVADIKVVEKILAKQDILLVLDPQHSHLYCFNSNLKNNQNDPTVVEAQLLDKDILAKGIFASTLSAHVSPSVYHFKVAKVDKLPDEPLANALEVFKQKQVTLGELVAQAKAGHSESLHLLLSVAYQAMGITSAKESKSPSQKLKYNLDKLAIPHVGADNIDCRAALAYLLRAVSNAHKKEQVSRKVYRQVMITGSELAILLDAMQTMPKDKPSADALFLEYFNIKKKFAAAIIGMTDKNVLAQSVFTDIAHKKQQESARNKARTLGFKPHSLEKHQRIAWYAITKLNPPTSNPAHQENWQRFCFAACSTSEGANQLAFMVTHLVKSNTHQQWFNLFFTEIYKAQQGDVNKTLSALITEFKGMDFRAIKKRQQLLLAMEAQIPFWADPTKFDKLYNEFAENVAAINHLLTYNGKLSRLNQSAVIQNAKQWIDVMDRTIKSLDYSTQYQPNEADNRLKAQRMRMLLGYFAASVEPWLKNAYPFEMEQLISLAESFNQDMTNTSSDTTVFRTSVGFDVRATLIVDNRNNPISRSADFSRCHSLEDWFTCLHQNFSSAVDKIEKQEGLIMAQELYPPVVAQFEKAFMNLKNKQIYLSNPEFHFSAETPVIIYRIPISQHHAMATVFQSPKTKDFLLQFVTGSDNTDDLARWRVILYKSRFDLALNGIELVDSMPFQHEINFTNSAKFCVKLTSESVQVVVDIIEQAIIGTSSFNQHTKEDEARFSLLEKLDEEQLKRVGQNALDLITVGYTGESHYLDKNTISRMKLLHKLCKIADGNQSKMLFLNIHGANTSREEKIKIIQFNQINKLLQAQPSGNSINSFFAALHSCPEFNDKFCTELTGFTKNEFTTKYLAGTRNQQVTEFVSRLLPPISKAAL